MSLYLFIIIMMGLDLIRLRMPELSEYIIDKIETILCNVSYNCIYYYSVCEINYNKFVTNIIDFLRNNNIEIEHHLFRYIKIIESFKDGNYISEYGLNKNDNMLSIVREYYNSSDCDLLVYTDDKNKICYKSYPTTLDYVISKLSFISVQVDYNGSIYKIELKNDDVNYYIVGNILDKQFFKYYFKHILKVNIDETEFEYDLVILTNDVEFITCDDDSELVILEDGYKIINLKEMMDKEIEMMQLNKKQLKDVSLEENEEQMSDEFIKLE